MTDEAACGQYLDHTVTIVGYSNKDRDIPFWVVKNSWGTGWGLQGYAYIAISDGPGVCGINQAAAYPNILLMSGPIEFGAVIGCLSFGLFIIFPISYFELKDSIKRGRHPAHKPFSKTLMFEGISFGLCWFFYMLTIFTNTTNYQFRQMVVFVFYCSIHLTYLSLHNCMALKSLEQQEIKYKHKGMSRCPLYGFSILYLVVMICLLLIVIMSKIGNKFGDSWVLYDLMHVSVLDTVMAVLLYITCAFVQGATLKNFFDESEKKYLKFTAYFGFSMGMVSFFFILSDIVCVIFYPGRVVQEWSTASSLVWSTCVMLPITHYMVINHQKHNPKKK